MALGLDKLRLLLAFAIVYFTWGSTYLAIRIGVHDIPPAMLAGTRFVLAGLILGTIAVALGQRICRDRTQWRHALVMGMCMMVIGNGLVTWSEVTLPSNQAALLITSNALWIALFGTLGPRAHALTPRAVAGLVVGFTGITLLFWPAGNYAEGGLLSRIAVVVAAMTWAGGTIYVRNFVTVTVRPMMFAAMQMFLGGIILLLIALASGETAQIHLTLPGVAALSYLVVFGSCIAYGTFLWLIQHTTPDRLGTIAYINPLVATVLGWWLLDEALSNRQLAGMAVIIVGVAMVSMPVRSGRRPPVP